MSVAAPRNAAAPAPGRGSRGAILTFAAADVHGAHLAALASSGAMEALPPGDYEGADRLCYREDGEGNLFGMIERVTEAV